MFADGIPDSVWQHATCPVVLLVVLVLAYRSLGGLQKSIDSLRDAVNSLRPPAELPAPHPNHRRQQHPPPPGP